MASLDSQDFCDACRSIVHSHEFQNAIDAIDDEEMDDEEDDLEDLENLLRGFEDNEESSASWEVDEIFPFLLYGEMVSSSRRGCALCRLIFSAVERRGVETVDFYKGEEQRSPPPSPLSSDIQLYYAIIWNETKSPPHLSVGTLEEERATVYLYPAASAVQNEQQFHNYNERRANPDQDLRSSTLSQICHWIEDCEESHTKCNLRKRTEQLKPRRLICVRDKTTATLQETATLSENTKYITLSHCWGNKAEASMWWQTEISQNGIIDTTTAPKVLRDAIQVTRSLHIEYLWVDALCIDQTSPDDWLIESAKMGDIYLEGYLNISAVAATNGAQGLFHETNISERMILSIQHRDSTARVLVSELPMESWNCQIEQSRLNERGWVLQERLLSPRILHFGKGEVFWECNAVQTGETIPRLINKEPYKSNFFDLFPRTEDNAESAPRSSRESAYRQWLGLIADYSQRNLTRSSDKIVAISGLAVQVAKHLGLPMTSFVAGLWTESLHYSLLWSVDGIRSFPDRAPSWSWARWDGRINVVGTGIINEEAEDHYHTRVLAVNSEHINGPCGSLGSVSIVLRGPLSPLHLSDTRKESCNDDDFGPMDTTAPSLNVEAWKLTWDDWEIKTATSGPYYALLMWTEHNEKELLMPGVCSGLVLAPTGIRGQFERVAYFQLEVTSVHAFSTRCRDLSKTPRDMYISWDPDEGFEIELI